MAAWLMSEDDHGCSSGAAHPHNGYYAGDFGGSRPWTPRNPLPSVASVRPPASGLVRNG